MLRSLTVGRVALVLAIASVFGLAIGAGMALVGAYITAQNHRSRQKQHRAHWSRYSRVRET